MKGPSVMVSILMGLSIEGCNNVGDNDDLEVGRYRLDTSGNEGKGSITLVVAKNQQGVWKVLCGGNTTDTTVYQIVSLTRDQVCMISTNPEGTISPIIRLGNELKVTEDTHTECESEAK